MTGSVQGEAGAIETVLSDVFREAGKLVQTRRVRQIMLTESRQNSESYTHVSLCKLSGVELCTLFGVSPRQQPRAGAPIAFLAGELVFVDHGILPPSAVRNHNMRALQSLSDLMVL